MAAPATKTLKNLNGRWQMAKSLSDNFEPVLALQGVSYLTRKAIGLATLTLHISEFEEAPTATTVAGQAAIGADERVTHVNIDQVLTGGLKGTTEKRCLDNRLREHSDWLFGRVSGRSLWVQGPDAAAAVVKEFQDEFLVKGFTGSSDGHDNDALIVSHVVNLDAKGGWVATQVWGFQTAKDGKRRHVRNVVVTKGGGDTGKELERVAVQLVYDFLGERQDESSEDADLTY